MPTSPRSQRRASPRGRFGGRPRGLEDSAWIGFSSMRSETPKLDIRFATGDKVKVKEGNFESFEGEVNTIDEASGRVTVMINIFGRSTPVELEYWQIEAV